MSGKSYFLNKIDWYIIKKVLATFFVSIILIDFVIIIIDLSFKIDDFIDRQAPLKSVFIDYYLNLAPYFTNQFGHLFFFISIVFVTSRLTLRSEIVAILASGISFKRLLRPYIVSAIFVGLFMLYLSNFLIPQLNVVRYEFERKYYRNKYTNMQTNIHIQTNKNTQVYVLSYNNENNVGYLYSQETFDKNSIIKKITADEARYDSVKKDWVLYNYTLRTIDGKQEQLSKGNTMRINNGLKPLDFNNKLFKVDVLDYFELNKAIERERMKGSNLVQGLLIEKNQRLFNPIAFIILTIIGVTLSCKKKRGGMGANLALAIALAFILILLMKIMVASALNGNLPPILGEAIPLFLFSIVAIILVKKAPK
ncbi:MAG: LptF/LptG family permease [Bacteroidota bacterium]|nr:LptF/LptG family permease [Bacteroidota bacterium]